MHRGNNMLCTARPIDSTEVSVWCWIPSMILYLWTVYLNISCSSSFCYSSPCSCLLFLARFRCCSICCPGAVQEVTCSVAWKVLWRGIYNKEVKKKRLLELISSTPCSPEKANGVSRVLFSQVQILPPLTGTSMQTEVCLGSLRFSELHA